MQAKNRPPSISHTPIIFPLPPIHLHAPRNPKNGTFKHCRSVVPLQRTPSIPNRQNFRVLGGGLVGGDSFLVEDAHLDIRGKLSRCNFFTFFYILFSSLVLVGGIEISSSPHWQWWLRSAIAEILKLSSRKITEKRKKWRPAYILILE